MEKNREVGAAPVCMNNTTLQIVYCKAYPWNNTTLHDEQAGTPSVNVGKHDEQVSNPRHSQFEENGKWTKKNKSSKYSKK